MQDLEIFKEFADKPEIEVEIAIAGAIQAVKAHRQSIKNKRYFEKVNTPIEYKKYTSSELFDFITLEKSKLFFGTQTKTVLNDKDEIISSAEVSKFVVDDNNREIIQILCEYFTEDKAFESRGYSFDKGIMLHGNVGCGKTKLMEMFASNPYKSYSLRACKEITDNYYRALNKKEDPNIHLDVFYNKINTGAPHKFFGHTELGFCFDDLGTDEEKKHFGNNLNVMGEILLARYNRKHELKGFTHITTNLTADQIEEAYGLRIRSRLRELVNAIAFPTSAPDRRN